MKTGSWLLILILLGCTSGLYAQEYKMAVGVRISNNAPVINNSISLKYFVSGSTAFEALFSFGDPLGFGLLAEKHKPVLGNNFQLFYGGGAFAGFSGPRRAGLQGILGMDYKITNIPFNLSLDWKPELSLTREFSFEPAAVGISARFTFR
jgi:hypothetical protein